MILLDWFSWGLAHEPLVGLALCGVLAGALYGGLWIVERVEKARAK